MPRDACGLARAPLTKIAGEGRQRWERAGEPFRLGVGELSTLTTFGHWLPGSRGMDPASPSLVSAVGKQNVLERCRVAREVYPNQKNKLLRRAQVRRSRSMF